MRIRISILLAVSLLTLLTTDMAAQRTETVIPRGAKVFIHPMEGFENYLSAAFDKKQTPVIVVADIEAADFEIKGTSASQKAGWAKIMFGTGRDKVSASIQMINMKTSVVAYSVASNKDNAWAGFKSAAEHIAKNVRKKIENDEKEAVKGKR